jgi:hypothetical protein
MAPRRAKPKAPPPQEPQTDEAEGATGVATLRWLGWVESSDPHQSGPVGVAADPAEGLRLSVPDRDTVRVPWSDLPTLVSLWVRWQRHRAEPLFVDEAAQLVEEQALRAAAMFQQARRLKDGVTRLVVCPRCIHHDEEPVVPGVSPDEERQRVLAALLRHDYDLGAVAVELGAADKADVLGRVCRLGLFTDRPSQP